jgi:hypothetical protein
VSGTFRATLDVLYFLPPIYEPEMAVSNRVMMIAACLRAGITFERPADPHGFVVMKAQGHRG